MFLPTFQSHLTPVERHQVRQLVIKDALALLSITLITILLAVATFFLFRSYTTHRKDLANRWFARGQKALSLNDPVSAINDFHSALLYAPGQRQIEVELASALASAGRIQEATAYFNTLWDAEPGNGEINLQLARLAVRSGKEDAARQYYHAAIYGNWEGDGYLRRRDARLELVRYLISRGQYAQARSELLVASGNAPASDLEVQLTVAGLLVQAHYPLDALTIDQEVLSHAPNDLQALRAAAQLAYDYGQYQLAHHYLQKAVDLPQARGADAAQHQQDEELLKKVSRILLLDPSLNLAPAQMAARLLDDREIARKRLDSCIAQQQPANATSPPANQPKAPGTSTAPPAAAPPLPPALAALAQGWANEPQKLTAAALIADPDMELQERSLILHTELVTSTLCGQPKGDDALLLRLAQVPRTDTSEAGHD